MNVAIILAGGVGTRLGINIPKQYLKVQGKPIIWYCLKQFFACDSIDAVQIVAEDEWHSVIEKCVDGLPGRDKLRGFSKPGTNRQLSIYHGLLDVEAYADRDAYVMIHDAARPLIKKEFIEQCFYMAGGHDGVLPVLPMKDTVYYSVDGKGITSLLKRENIFAGQAPEVFGFWKYLKANRALLPDRILQINGSTEPAVLAGMDIRMITGDEGNFKVTTKEDLERLQQILKG